MVKSYSRLTSTPFRIGLLIVVTALAVRFAFSPLPGYDVRDYRNWAEAVNRDGLSPMYRANHSDPFYNYLPGYLYVLDVTARVYRVFSPSFDTTSPLLERLIKTPPILADAGIALAIYLFLLGRVSTRSAVLGSLAYALNPAIIWNTAYWGGIDSLHTLFAFLSFLPLVRGQPGIALPLLTLSLSFKPLAAPAALVVAFLTLTRFDLKKVAWSAVLAGATGLVLIAPFLSLEGISEMVVAQSRNMGNYSFLSANGHNFWWVVSGGNDWWINDTDLLFGVVSYRYISFALVFSSIIFTLLLLRRKSTESHVFFAGGFISFAFVMLFTQVHENWLFTVFPFFIVAAALEPRLKWVPIILTATFTINLASHDLAFGYSLPEGFLGSFLFTVRLVNSIVNTAVLIYGGMLLYRFSRPKARAYSQSETRFF